MSFKNTEINKHLWKLDRRKYTFMSVLLFRKSRVSHSRVMRDACFLPENVNLGIEFHIVYSMYCLHNHISLLQNMLVTKIEIRT